MASNNIDPDVIKPPSSTGQPVPRHNHVIFLGAGASFTSGYPIGQGLRLRMASEERFREELNQYFSLDNNFDPMVRDVHSKCVERFADFKDSIELFRHGGFGTVDEFSKLASDANQNHVQNMKRLMRICLSLHNPEKKFHESDYYPFIQRLFRGDKLDELRSDITVITYNYDCYLDFLLMDAFRHRQKLSGNPLADSDFWLGKLTSGFFDPNGTLGWAEQSQGFNYFKLHGSIGYANESQFGHETLFRRNAIKRIATLGEVSSQQKIPPVVFPWELFDGNSGGFISEDEFVFVKHPDSSIESAKEAGRRLFKHFKEIWKNAQRVVARADKISFVGLSMHPYMLDGLAYLFKGKSNGVQAVVANQANENFKNAENRLHPASLCGRVAEVFRHIAPNMKYVRSSSEDDGIFRDKHPDQSYNPDITPRYSFKEFIELEMD